MWNNKVQYTDFGGIIKAYKNIGHTFKSFGRRYFKVSTTWKFYPGISGVLQSQGFR
jgi:hypothetical protein